MLSIWLQDKYIDVINFTSESQLVHTKAIDDVLGTMLAPFQTVMNEMQ